MSKIKDLRNASMDQNKDLYHCDSKCSIDFTELLNLSGNEKKKVARRRWAILAKALKSPTGSEPCSPTDEYSVRRISSFMLLETERLATIPLISNNQMRIDRIAQRTWYCYSTDIAPTRYYVNVGHRKRTYSAEDLMGFNNTGNICIWPSEETLSYFICKNLGLFENKRVLELGGGMSCLAGLFVAKYGHSKHVTLTDGNKTSIENVSVTLLCNKLNCSVECKVLKWNEYHNEHERYDIILCADCLFFDEARGDLIDCLFRMIQHDGLVLVMAPNRGQTLKKFIEQSTEKGFYCKKVKNYDNIVWQKRLNLLGSIEFDDNIHYPILIKMTKNKCS